MRIKERVLKLLGRLNPRVLSAMEKSARTLPGVREKMDREFAAILEGMEESAKPYRDRFPTYSCFPEKGRDPEKILREMEELRDLEKSRWEQGYASGAVYHGDPAFIDFLNRAYALHSQSNPLHTDLWPSATKFESEIISMTARMLGADPTGTSPESPHEVCGSVSSGGTESILLAMKAYRDWAVRVQGISSPEMVVPTTAHAAFDKAAEYFRIGLTRVPVGNDYRAEISAMKNALTKNTAVLVGSAPSFPHGVIDPIEELSEIAHQRGIGFHTDACLGGFVLPWAEKLGYEIPRFDFRLPGVTSISVDTHKFGYAPKGTSVVLYRTTELRSHQFFTVADWPGGLYCSPTFAGSRPGGPIAACWAALLATGEEGYLDATKKILETGARIRKGIEEIPDLHVLGDPLWVIAFGSEDLDIYQIMELMSQKGWSLNGLHHPPCVHLCVTLRHTEQGVAERFLEDLRDVVEHVRSHPEEKTGSAPIYGMAATLPFKGVVHDLLKKYMEVLYKI